MGQLDALGRGIARVEQKLQPVNHDRVDARVLITFCTDSELDQMLSVFVTAAQRQGVPRLDELSPEIMTEQELALFEHIERQARQRQLAKEERTYSA